MGGLRVGLSVVVLVLTVHVTYGQHEVFSPAMQSLQDLPCSDQLPQIILAFSDYQDCLESKQHSHRDVAVICEPQVRKVMTKVGLALKDTGCHSDAKSFFKENVADADFANLLAQISGLDECQMTRPVADCLDGLGQSGEAVVEQLTNGVDGTSREIILRLNKARGGLSTCLSQAPTLKSAFDPKKWGEITNGVAALAQLYADMAVAFAERTNDKTKALLTVYYGETRESDSKSSADLDLKGLFPAIQIDRFTDPRTCRKEWLEFKGAARAVSRSQDARASLSAVLERVFLLGEARKLITIGIGSGVDQLLTANDCLFDFETSAELQPCLNEAHDATKSFYNEVVRKAGTAPSSAGKNPVQGEETSGGGSVATYLVLACVGVAMATAGAVAVRKYKGWSTTRRLRGEHNSFGEYFEEDDAGEATSMADFLDK